MWQEIENSLTKNIVLNNFSEVINLVNKIAKIAEQENHHPDLRIFDYKNLEIKITTHEAGKITKKDFKLAKEIDKLLQS